MRALALCLSLCFIATARGAFASAQIDSRLFDFSVPGESDPSTAVNSYLHNCRLPGSCAEQVRTLKQVQLTASLTTPLNSELTKPGDRVTARIDRTSDQQYQYLQNAVLEGTVESVQTAGRLERPAEIVVRFYWLECNNQRWRLHDVAPSALDPMSPASKPTKKAVAKAVLMTASKVAIPLAIGSGGISLAITAGAGAVIGGALSEKGHHITGALRGAWEGAGLSAFDPIVCKGPSVRLPQGSLLSLRVNGCVRMATRANDQVTQLNTRAKLLTPLGPDRRPTAKKPFAEPDEVVLSQRNAVSASPEEVQVLKEKIAAALASKDVPIALQVLETARQMDPSDNQLASLYNKLVDYVSGMGPYPEI